MVRMTVGSSGSRGDLRIELISPNGTTSTLIDFRDNDVGSGYYLSHGFMSVHFWSENPAGEWTLRIMSRNILSPIDNDISSTVMTMYGTDVIPQVIANIPMQCDSLCAGGCAREGSQFCDACTNLRNAHTRECISVCPSGYQERNGYCFDPNIPEPVCRSMPQGNLIIMQHVTCFVCYLLILFILYINYLLCIYHIY